MNNRDRNSFDLHAYSNLSIVTVLLCCLCAANVDASEAVTVYTELNLQSTSVSPYLEAKELQQLIQNNAVNFAPHNAQQVHQFSEQQSWLLQIQTLGPVQPSSNQNLLVQPGLFTQVEYFHRLPDNTFSEVRHRFKANALPNYSGQVYGFEITPESANNTHYLVLHATENLPISVAWLNATVMLQSATQSAVVFALIIGMLLSLSLVHGLAFLSTKKPLYMWYALVVYASAAALIVPSTLFNYLAWLVWPLGGQASSMLYWMVAHICGILFGLKLLHLRVRHSWWLKLVIFWVVIQCSYLGWILLHQAGWVTWPDGLNPWHFYAGLMVPSLLMWLAMLQSATTKNPVTIIYFAAYFAWLLVLWVLMSPNLSAPLPEPWLPHIAGLILLVWAVLSAYAITRQKPAPVVAKPKPNKNHNKTEFQQQLITQFQHEMLKLVKDPRLSHQEVWEKTNIKFHLLINRAFPIMNSILFENNEFHGFCTSGLTPKNLEAVVDHVNQLSDEQKDQLSTFSIDSHNQHPLTMVYVPLDSKQNPNTQLVFGLQPSKSFSLSLLPDFKAHCEAAYAVLKQAKTLHLDAAETNFDQITQCHNLSSIETIAEDSLDKCSRTTVAVIKLLNLSEIRGHNGDAVVESCLVEFSGILRNALMNYAKLGRTGDNEFVAVFSDIEFTVCEELIELWLLHFAKNPVSKQKIALHLCAGMAESRVNDSHSSLFKKANTALSNVEQQGTHHYAVYEPGSINELP